MCARKGKSGGGVFPLIPTVCAVGGGGVAWVGMGLAIGMGVAGIDIPSQQTETRDIICLTWAHRPYKLDRTILHSIRYSQML